MPDPTKEKGIPKTSLEDRLNEANKGFISSLSKGKLDSTPRFIGSQVPEYGESKYDQSAAIPTIESGNLNEHRAQTQSSLSKLGGGLVNTASSIVLDGLKDASYLLDFEQHKNLLNGTEQEFGNWFGDIMEKGKEATHMDVYRTKASEGFHPESAGWWADAMPSIGSSLSMVIPTMGAVKAFSTLGKVSRLTQGLSKLGVAESTLEGITGTVMSRYMENTMEGKQTFDDTYKKALDKGATPEIATQVAGEAARNNWLANSAMVTQDLFSYMSLFKGFKGMSKGAKIATTMGSEGGEEMYQYTTNKETQRKALLNSGLIKDNSTFTDRLLDYTKDPEFWTSGFLGAVGGGIFSGVSAIKDVRNQTKYNSTLESHKAILTGDKEGYYKAQDQEFNNTILTHTANKTLDKLKDDLEFLRSKPERIDDNEDRPEILKRINDKLDDINHVEKIQSLLNGQTEKSNEVKGQEIIAHLDFISSSRRLQQVNNEIHTLTAKDGMTLLHLESPEILNYKAIKLKSTALVETNPQEASKLDKEAEKLAKIIVEGDNTINSLEELDREIITSNDDTLKNLYKHQDIEKRNRTETQDKILKLNTKEGQIEVEKEFKEKQVQQVKEVKTKEAEVSKETKIASIKVDKKVDIESRRKIEIDKLNEDYTTTQTAIENAHQQSGEPGVADTSIVDNKYNEDLKNIHVKYDAELSQVETQVITDPVKEVRKPVTPVELTIQKTVSENTEDGIVPILSKQDKTRIGDSIKDSLVLTNEDGKEFGPQGGSIRVGKLIVNAANSIAYLSKKYTEEVILNRKQNKIILSDTEDGLNDQMQEPMLLSSTEYQVGDELTIEVDTAFNLVKEDNTSISYTELKDDALRVPMKISNKEGKIIGYLHDIDWVTHENVANTDGNVEHQRKLLTSLRYSIFEDGVKKVKIDSKSYGTLSIGSEERTTSEAIESKDNKFAVGKNGKYWTGLEEVLTGELPINKEVKSGVVYMIVNTPVKDKQIAFPMWHTKASEETIDTLSNAVEAFFKQDVKVGDMVLNATGHDILTNKGLRDFFNLYVSTNGFDQSQVNKAGQDGETNRLFLDVAGSGIKYAMGGNFLVEVGNAEHWNRDEFKEHMNYAFNSIFLKHMGNKNFKTASISNEGIVTAKESTYDEYVKNITTTNIVEHELPDGSHTYFVQPVITFTTNTEAEKQIEQLDTAKAIEVIDGVLPAGIFGDTPNELGSIDLGDIQLNDDENYTPPNLTTEQTNAIAKDSSLINGFNASQQTQVIGVMNSYILKKLKEKDNQNRDDLYKELHGIFNKYAKYYNSAKPSLGAEFKKIVDNFDKLKEQSQDRLKMFNVVENKIDGSLGVEDVESSNEKTNFDDGATFQIDSKEGMSNRLKQFLSFVPNSKKSYIGLDQYMPYDEVVNYLSGQLAGLDASYQEIAARLDEISDSHTWIKDVKTLLDNSSNRVKNEFVQWATKHYTGFKVVQIQGKAGEVGEIKVMDSDQNSLYKLIQSKWLSGMKASSLVKETTPGTLIIDNSQRKALIDEFKTLSTTSIEPIREWLAKVGVIVSPKTLESIRENSRKSFALQFTEGGGIFKVIADKIALESTKEDDSFDTNNPLLDNSGIRRLAYLEASHSDAYFSNSFKSGEGKSIFSYSANKYFINQFYKLKHNKNNYLLDLLGTSFASTSSWGNKLMNENSYFKEVFDYFYMDTLNIGNEAVTLASMSSREHELAKLALFQNQNNGSPTKGLISHFMFPTMSDKSTMVGISAIRHNIKVSFDNGNIKLGSETIDALYDIVDGEYNRIRDSYNIDNSVDGYKPNRFYFFEELNDNEFLWDIHGNSRTLKPMNDTIKGIIKGILDTHITKLIQDKLSNWESIGITKEGALRHSDITYMNGVRSMLRGVNKNEVDMAKFVASDFVVNYIIANANSFQLFIGDPAQFWKKNMEETWINIGKRLAAEIAPGLELADSKGNMYRQAFVKDASGVLAISKNYKQLERLIGKKAAEPYKKIESTDAQEWTTLAEHLYVLVKSGKLDEAEVEGLLAKEESGTLDKHDYTRIFQPVKPVMVTTQIDKSLDLNRKIYIKSSSFPIVKGLSPELDKVRAAMINQKIDRLAFKTATKVGGPLEFNEIFTKEGKISDDIQFTSALELSREGFRLQQEVPFDPKKQEINRGTQESKLLFANILDIKGFEYNGSEHTGEQLYEKYNDINRQLYENAKNKFLNEINDEHGRLDYIKVQNLLQQEAIGRGWPQNDINALALITKDEILKEFALPLWSSTSASRIEALLNSLVDNRVRKQKMRGNSFVLGSEEGFVGNSKHIIYTDSYNPETGLLPMRIDEKIGKVLPAQILISNKIRDKEGKLIDLRKYKTKEGKLDLTKLSPEILEAFGFRIPSQLHSSMAFIEVVGILPSYMGDLVIAPKDFTKQMGSDFDVDKLYTYMFETEEIDGVLIKAKSLKNDLLDIHLSVMKHEEVLKQTLQPLGFGNLHDLAARVDKARNERKIDNTKYTRLSDNYQKEKYLKARAGKDGVGVKSLDSVFTSISQKRGLYFREEHTNKDGQTIEAPINLVFKDEHGKVYTLNDISSVHAINGVPKITVVAAYQSAAVDNEKEQILEKINSNNYTFDAERALVSVGLTEDYIVPLTGQDIIFEYVELMSKAQDNLNDNFISRPEDKIVQELKNKYKELSGMSNDVYEESIDADYPLSQQEMWDAIEKGKEDPNYYKTQLRALVKFNKAREMGKEISNIQLSINTDSSGISPSMIESNFKEAKVDELGDNPMVAGALNLLDNTINGYATEDALRVANRTWSSLFPYYKEGLKTIFEEVAKVTTNGSTKKTLTNEQRIKLFNQMKSFIYSKQDLGLDTEEINSLRHKLFFDTKDNKSLARRVRELQKTSNNPFVIRLMPEEDMTGHTPSLLKYNAAASENFDEISIHQGFTDLLLNPNTRELGQDLISYFYISGGLQQAIQFGKYIPTAYLTNIEFAKSLRGINFDDETLFGIVSQKQNYYDVSNFTRQYLQHNPGQAVKLKEDKSQIKNVKFNSKKELIEFESDENIGSELLSKKNNPTTGRSFEGLPEFVSIYNKGSKKKFDLFEYVGNNKYKKINTLGTFGYSEYNQSTDRQDSLIEANKVKTTISDIKPRTDNRDSLEEKTETVVENNQPKINRVESYKLNTGDINQSLQVISNSSNKGLAEVAKFLLTLPEQNQPKIVIDDTMYGKGSYRYSKEANQSGELRINPKEITSDEDMERVILHEYIHHLTGYTLNSKTRTKEQEKVVQSLKMLQKQLLDKIMASSKAKEEYEKFVKDYVAKNRLDEFSVSKYYAAYEIAEFTTMIMTDTAFQKILNNIPFNESKSMLDRFIDIIKNLMSSLGFPVNKNSVLAQGLHDTIELINLNNQQYTNDIVESHLPSQEYSKESIINKLMNEHIIGKTKFNGNYFIFKDKINAAGESQYKANITKAQDIIDTELQLYGESSIKLVSTNNATAVLINKESVDRIADKIERGEQNYSPITTKPIKYQKSIDTLQDRINFIKKRIASNKSNRELVTKLNAQVKDLEGRIQQIKDEDKLADIINYGNTDMKDLTNILTKDKVSDSDLFYANKILHQWETALDSLFKEGDLMQVDGQYSANVQAVYSIINTAQSLRMTYNKVFDNASLEMFKEQGINTTIERIKAPKKEINAISANMLDISRSGDQLLDATALIIKRAAFETEQELITTFDELDSLYEKATKSLLFKKHGFKILAQEDKGGKTGNLISRFSQSFYDTATKFRKEARETGGKAGWSKYFNWKKENSIVFDLRKLFYEEYQEIDGKHKYSQEAITDHINDLKLQLGDKGYQRYLDKVKNDLNRYKEDLEWEKQRVDALEADESEKASILDEWIKTWSPFVYAETIYDGVKNKVGTEFIVPRGYKYTSEVPRKYVPTINSDYSSGLKKTGWYDEKFEQVENDEALYNFYNYVIDKNNELYEHMPEYVVDELQHNYLPEIHKNIIEQFSDKGMTKGLTGWYDKVINTLTTDDVSTKSYAERDPRTGEIIRSLPITMLGGNMKTEDKSYDILKVAKAFSTMAIAYKHRSKVEDSIRLAEQIMNQSLERQENAKGEHLVDAQGRTISTSNGLKNLKKQFDYAVEAGFYGHRKDQEGISKKSKLLTTEELSTKKELNKELKIAKEEDKPLIQAKIDALGAHVVASSVWDGLLKFVQLKGMGWNLFAPLSNTTFAFVSNAIHASGGEDFDLNDFFWAQGVMLNSIGKSASLDIVKSTTSKKINALMSFYNAVGEVDQQAYQSTSFNTKTGKGLQKLSPLELTKRAEFLNQGVTFLAMMKATKITDLKGVEKNLWEAYDINGKWKTEEFGEQPEWTSNKDDMFKFKNRFEQVKKIIHGNYDPNSPVLLKKKVMGRALIMFRSWIAEGFASRFEGEKYDELLGRSRKGRLRTYNPLTGGDLGHIQGTKLLLLQMANFLSFGGAFKTSLDQLSPLDKANMRKNAAEVMIYLTFVALYYTMKAVGSDDDDEKKLANAMLNVIIRTQNDMAFFTSPLAFEKITQSSVPAMSIITDAAKLVQAIQDDIVGKGIYKRGIYKGQSKIKVNLGKNIPGFNQALHTYSGLMNEPQ